MGRSTNGRWKSTLRLARHLCLAAAIVGAPLPALAAETSPAGESARPVAASARTLSSVRLDDLVAPVALYPDPLLSQVLVASTHPLDVVEARQWLRRNGGLKGESLLDAARRQSWDASVQALVAFPGVLDTLSQDVEWTEELGNAFLTQEPDVMAAIQRMRARAESNGKLSSTAQQKVKTATRGGETAVEIEPADPLVIYVPQYSPVYVWGPPAWGAYPPLAYAGGFGFGPAIDVGLWLRGWAGWESWGWWPNWYGGVVVVNAPFFAHFGLHGYPGDRYRAREPRHREGEPWHHQQGRGMSVPSPNGRVVLRQHAPPETFRRTAPRFDARRSHVRAAPPFGSRPLTASLPRGTTLWPGGSWETHPYAGGESQRWHERFERTRPSGSSPGTAVASGFPAFEGSLGVHAVNGFHGTGGIHVFPGATRGEGHQQ